MNSIIGLGKYLFAIPFAIFGLNHFMMADMMASNAPFGGKVMVYITGVALLAVAASMLIGKLDKLAAVLLAVLLLLIVFTMHLPGALEEATRAASMPNLLKDIALTGGALMYAGSYAKDNSVIG
jgi:putative oxidoreductase